MSNEITDNFSTTLDRIQEENAWSNERLADEMGITSRQLQRWRSGEARPPLRRARDLAAKFGMSTGEFLGMETTNA